MKKTKLLHGFELIQSQEISEINCNYNRYRHRKSGADLIFLACSDNNKAFNITFKTIPEDDTGCPHILEHSVLNGSKNYPAKGTFMELVKGSLNTFINAMTSADWTSYPVASTNDKDFINLMRVYLDAVLYPRIYEESRILDQEGWHYELFSEDAEINYRGVVYNEMKGAFSSVDSIINRYCQHAQFPDTPYGFESGGDPDSIPELTQEKFTQFHSKYYHPSNSKIWLYGDMDIDATLKIIDEEYLSNFDDPGIRIELPEQKPFKALKQIDCQYPLGDDTDPTDQYYLALNFTYGKVTDTYLDQKLSLLCELLMYYPASPLKNVIRESGLCKDSTISVQNDILQPTITIICKQVQKDKLKPLSELIRKELSRISKEGFDKKMLEAMINYKEFFLREAQLNRFPKGLFYNLYCLGLWNHGGDPSNFLAFEGYLKELRRGLKEPMFETLVQEVFLENTHSTEVHFEPIPGLIAKQEAITKAKLDAYKKKLSKKEISELIAYNKDLKAWQEALDSDEDIQKIPLLNLSDVDSKAQSLPCESDIQGTYTILKHPVHTNGIVYLKAFFDLSHANVQDLPWIKLYTQLLGQINSENFSFGDLSNEISNNTGGINLYVDVANSYQTPDDILPKLVLSGKAIASKTAKLMDLCTEYALRPALDNPSRIKSLIMEFKTAMEHNVINSGMQITVQRMFAPFSQYHAFKDKINGLDYLNFLRDLANNMESDIDKIIGELKWVQSHFFNIHKAIFSITANEELIDDVVNKLPAFTKECGTDEHPAVENEFITSSTNEGIAAPIKIQYVVQGGNFFRKGYSYSGRLRVLANILSNEFLYKELRVKGGAYGGGTSFGMDGYQYFYSYRDPNLRESLDVYSNVPEFIRSFKCSKRDMNKYILGEISQLDYPKTPEAMGTTAAMDYITGFTQEDRQQIRDEVLSTNLEDLRQYADLIQAILDKNHYAVMGNEAKIKDAADLFDMITPLFKK
ncbi:MAG: insulinase family protein [Candidatus Cloacimonadaceae bacterium]|jgi:hypothetical protein|nr:insulinase family protein [Candidatus Cloacimonadota bacterium]MDD4559902.1 insulinase family protein [Candidatus Cloacimonadota bacterium]